jgi:hypothetical protein
VGPEYVVLSERLVQELVDRSAKAGREIQNVQLRPPLTGITAGRRGIDGNYHLLAEQITEAVSDETGTPEWPGEYIGARLGFSGWLFSFEAERTPVVWFVSEFDQSLLVACGSARNVIGYEAPKQYPGWRPSSADGLREVVAALRKKDPTTLIGYQANETQQREMASDAAWITNGLKVAGPPEIEGDFDLLMKPYVYVEDFSQNYITGLSLSYERVIVGAPLWVRGISDHPIPGVK